MSSEKAVEIRKMDTDNDPDAGVGGDGGDLEHQISKIVSKVVAKKGEIFDEKLKYWNDSVNSIMNQKFKEQNDCLFKEIQ